MPLPSPKKSEKQGDFISRCAGNETMNKDFPETKQRVAVCYSQWEKAKASAVASYGEGANEVLFGFRCPECVEAAQKTYGGKKRSELKDSDFLFPETRSFPIVTPQDVRDAINNYGRMGGNMTYDAFVKKLYRKARSKGQAFVDAIPESTKKEHNLTASEEKYIIVENYKDCPFALVSMEEDETELEYCFSTREDAEEMLRLEMAQMEMEKKQDPNYLQKKMIEEMVEEKVEEKMEEKSEEEIGKPVEAAETLEEYKKDFYEMSVGSLNSIKKHADNILMSLENPMVKENLTESWLQGRIAITEDYMLTIHNYVMFVEEDDMEESEVDATAEDLTVDNLYIPEEDEYVTAEEFAFNESDVIEFDIAKERPGLWENIRRKKKREGKNYRPAKPGDKDRPSKEAWKKAQGAEYKGRKVTLNKPFRTPGGPKKFAVYTKNESGNVVIVRFGDPNMEIRRDDPERRRNFRARHNCDNPGPKYKARYWSCQWGWSPTKKVGA